MICDQGNDDACSLPGGVAFGDDGFLVLSWWCLVCSYKEQITIAGLFFL
jgi:hypothetical protein